MTTLKSVIASRRFGYGAAPGDLDRYGPDPVAVLLDEIDKPELARLDDPRLPTTSAAVGLMIEDRQRRKAERQRTPAPGMTPDSTTLMTKPDGRKRRRRMPGRLFRREILARVDRALTTPVPFAERWVAFWANHFTVSARKGGYVRGIVGAYEREAIRPNVFGTFEDLLVASVSHPAMLSYLDNYNSTGPNSPRGLRSARGLNENLAREILELHTLGVNGGYDQADVTAFAKILTGWSVTGRRSGRPGEFRFRPRWHEPGAFQILGVRYEPAGRRQGLAVLHDLAHHRSTSQYVARRLARHFVSETPPRELVAELDRTFLTSGGNLTELAKTLVTSKSVWSSAPTKILPPFDLLINYARALGWTPGMSETHRLLRVFDHLPFTAPSPAGWPDGDAAWAGPDALLERLDWTDRLTRAQLPDGDPMARAKTILGPLLTEQTRLAMRQAASPQQAFVLFLMSREFQRR